MSGNVRLLHQGQFAAFWHQMPSEQQGAALSGGYTREIAVVGFQQQLRSRSAYAR